MVENKDNGIKNILFSAALGETEINGSLKKKTNIVTRKMTENR